MNERETFLKRHWSPFPEAPKGTLDVSEYLRKKPDRAWVGGRVHSISPLVLESQGAFLDLSGDEILKIESENGSSHEFAESAPIPEHCLRIGDWILVSRHFRTTKGSFARSKLFLAAPNEHELPARDFDVKESRRWMEFVSLVRAFFLQEDFIELATPYLVKCPGTEPFLNAFSTRLRFAKQESDVFLPTSPELHLKKTLARGWARVFEIKTCFRNDECGPHHQPEFHMLEWYRSFSRLDDLINDIRNLFARFVEKNWLHPSPEIKVVPVAEMFRRWTDFDLTPQTTREELMQLCDRLGVHTSQGDSWDELFFRIFLERIENRWDQEQIIILTDYPATQSALARIQQNGWAGRFEVYWRGMELANAFSELNDPRENRKRYDKDRADRAALGKPILPPDEEFFQSMESGLPPSAGIALGLDRLYMTVFQKTNIAQTRLFPHGVD